ncbi:hypothetical protein AMAG_20084 [Allomyces macrogynus ATCC 38327]|uniref:Nascent polypeptide-associated complex subunit beta n=2 Tax=Allomyces macrogynus (strain ATCC 38327) TaxID=578462 RepID=A0A0L0T6V2_ALLM3|nr:hypothetical protein AMAG_20084 [Allomyces macrogynus ATCC 38327]|eukprot:KNE70314.1 hypothetical protein AMAG_20084 [Allomyces macrogynus ATCC 38327]
MTTPAVPEKLAQLQKSVRAGGKGAPRRKVPAKKAASGSAAAAKPVVDDKRVQSALKKLNVQQIAAIEEVNMFKDDGKILHFPNPKVQAAVQSNTFAVYGRAQEKELSDMLPAILGQLGSQSTNYLQKMIEQMGGMQAIQSMAAGMGGAKVPSSAAAAIDEDEDVPELVENFDEAADE